MSEATSFTVENALLIFKNFSGKEGMYNREGDRNFSVILEHDVAEVLIKDGWNVKLLKPREEDEAPTPYIQVTVNYNNMPPKIVMISSNARTILDEDSVSVLDWTDIKQCDLIARAYSWSVNGKTGVKAYLKTMFVTIEEDDLELKYASQEGEPF